MSSGPPRAISTDASARIKDSNIRGSEFATKMQEIYDALKEKLTYAQANYEGFANTHRTPATAYEVGDHVWLDSRNIKTNRPMKKLDWKFIGPFKVLETRTHSYKLDLPSEMIALGIHPVFNTDLLKPATKNLFPGQKNPPPPPIAIDTGGEVLWKIEKILDPRRQNRKPQYKVLWAGYPENDATWQPLEDIVHLRNTINEYEEERLRKTKPAEAEIARARLIQKNQRSGEAAEELDEDTDMGK